jgi:hypothetical protein
MFEKVYDFVGSIFHFTACLIAIDWYNFTEYSETCTEEEFGLTKKWLELEIFVFYNTIIGTMIFLFMSRFLLHKTGLTYLEKRDTDFLQRYGTMNGFYSTFYLTLVITINYLVEGSAFKNTEQSLTSSLFIFMLISQFNKFFAVNLQLFATQNLRERYRICLSMIQGLLIIIITFFIVIA